MSSEVVERLAIVGVLLTSILAPLFLRQLPGRNSSPYRCSRKTIYQVAVRGRECVYSNADMKCPFCRMDNDRVIDSRSSQDGLAIRRRRECLSCSRRFTTYERPEE